MIKIPKKLKIGAFNYTIEMSNNLHIKNGLQGVHYGSQCLIKLQIGGKDGYNRQKVELNFFHEVLHAIDATYNDSGLDEKTVDGLANGLYQVFKDNNLLK